MPRPSPRRDYQTVRFPPFDFVSAVMPSIGAKPFSASVARFCPRCCTSSALGCLRAPRRATRDIPAKTDRCRRNAAWSGIAPERKPDPICGKINGLAPLGIPRRIFPKDAEAKPQVAFRHRLGMPRLSEPAVPKRRFCCTWPCENTHPAEAARPGHGWAGRHRRAMMARAGRPGAARRGTRLSGATRPGQRTRQRSRARTRPGDRAGGRGTTGTQPERTRSTSPIRAARARNETERPEGRSARMPRMRLNARS